jgi:hypothetical protein
VRLLGVSRLRWAAAARAGNRAVDYLATAVKAGRNVVDKSLGIAWTKLLAGSPFDRMKVDRAALRTRLLWQLDRPGVADLEIADRYFAACVPGTASAVSHALSRMRKCRLVNDAQQQIASEAWTDLALELATVPAGSRAEGSVRAWANEHLTVVRYKQSLRECSLADRLIHANRPDAEARTKLRAVLERELPHLLPWLEHVADTSDSADMARTEWGRACADHQRVHDRSCTDFLEARDAFLRSLDDATKRSTKG